MNFATSIHGHWTLLLQYMVINILLKFACLLAQGLSQFFKCNVLCLLVYNKTLYSYQCFTFWVWLCSKFLISNLQCYKTVPWIFFRYLNTNSAFITFRLLHCTHISSSCPMWVNHRHQGILGDAASIMADRETIGENENFV